MRKTAVFTSIIIIIELVIGIFAISPAIVKAVENNEREWASAIKADTKEEYYAALNEECEIYVYGKMVAVDPVTNENVEGEYSYIEEEYQVPNGDGGWATKSRKKWHCKKFKFYEDEYAYGDIQKPSVKYGKNIVEKAWRERYRYNTISSSFKGVLHITKDGSYKFHPGATLNGMAPISKGWALGLFWFGWIVLFCFVDWCAVWWFWETFD